MKQHGIHDMKVTDNKRAITMEMNSKLYKLQIILLINYMMEENLFVNVE